jgi:hypothetical protein
MKYFLVLCLLAFPAWAKSPAHFSAGATISGTAAADHFVGDGSGLTGVSGGGGVSASSLGLTGFSNLVMRTDQISASDTVTATFNVAILVNAAGAVTRTTSGAYPAKIGIKGIGGLDAGTISSTNQWLYATSRKRR